MTPDRWRPPWLGYLVCRWFGHVPARSWHPEDAKMFCSRCWIDMPEVF